MLVAALIGAVVGAATGAISSYVRTGSVDKKAVLIGAAVGAVPGLTMGAATSLALTAGIIGGATAFASTSTVAGVAAGSAIGAGSSTVVIGETKRRDNEYASKIKAKTYSGLVSYNDLVSRFGPTIANFLGKVDNAKWLLSQMLNNSRFVDIEIDLDRASRSSSYLMERILSFFYTNKEVVIQLVEKATK